MNRILRSCAAGVIALSSALAFSACSGKTTPANDASSDSGKLSVFATTGYLADAVKNIAPEADVITMVGPGGDPHTYEPSTQDTENIKNADLVVWEGLHMEAHMIDMLSALDPAKSIEVGPLLPESELLDWPETDDKGNKLHDPHIWNDPQLWEKVVTEVGKKLAEVDSANASTYTANAEAYNSKIESTMEEATKILSGIPAEQRILVSGHDAFNYFGRAFNFEVHATDFVSSEAQMSPAEIDELAALIAEKKVPTIFVDNLANPQAITSLKEAVKAKGWDVKVSDKELYADSLGEEAPTDTYLGVLKYNAEALAEALGK